MRINEVDDTEIFEARLVWRKMGKTVKRAVRCTSGRRKGRVVSKPSQCGAPIDFKKRLTLKKTKAKFGARIARKARRSKKYNPISRRVASLNKSVRFKPTRKTKSTSNRFPNRKK
jgi:hypothetical protein